MNLKASYSGFVLLLACVVATSPAAPAAAEKEKTTPELVQIAKSRAEQKIDRQKAIEKLGDISDEKVCRENRAGDELIAIANSREDDLFLRVAAIRAVGKLQTQTDPQLKIKYMPTFIGLLKASAKEHMMVRRAIVDVFRNTLKPGELQDEQAFKALLPIATNKDEGEGLRAAAIEAIGEYGSLDGLETLVTLLSDPALLIREKAAAALFALLGKASSADAVPLPAVNKLIEMIADVSMTPELRVNAMKVLARLIRLGSLPARRAMDPIIKIVGNEKETKLVKGGIQALGVIGSAEGVDALEKAYSDYLPAAGAAPAPAAGAGGEAAAPIESSKDTEVREAVMFALESVLSAQDNNKMPDTKAVHKTAVLLVRAVDDDPSLRVKAAAVFAARYLHPAKFKNEQKEVVDALIYLLRATSTGEALKQKVLEALVAITGQDYGLDAKRWNEWFEIFFKMRPRPAPAPRAPAPKKVE
ncbi:MAG: HEAT repeat domain-containing protein [Planctomycetota bacterium]|nr:HEAT repeat domain-containing protein [Planctomycetota bacterium]